MFESWWMSKVVAMGVSLVSFLSHYGLPTYTSYFVPKDITLLWIFVKQQECNLKPEKTETKTRRKKKLNA